MKKIQIVAIFMASVAAGLMRLVSKLSKKMKTSMAIATLVAIAILIGHSMSTTLVNKTPSQAYAATAQQVRGKEPFEGRTTLITKESCFRCHSGAEFTNPSVKNVQQRERMIMNGGQLTQEQVSDFYNRGGEFNEHIQSLNLSAQDKTGLVPPLKALADERVRL